MTRNFSQEWRELNIDVKEFILPKNPKKLKLLADQNIPLEIIKDFSQYGFSIKSIFDLNYAGHPDENVREIAKKLKRVLLTTDKDFWDEKKHPLQKCFGIICCAAGPEDIAKISYSFARLHVYFAKYYPHDWWDKTKAFIKTEGFILRMIKRDGNISEDEYVFNDTKIMTRKIR